MSAPPPAAAPTPNPNDTTVAATTTITASKPATKKTAKPKVAKAGATTAKKKKVVKVKKDAVAKTTTTTTTTKKTTTVKKRKTASTTTATNKSATAALLADAQQATARLTASKNLTAAQKADPLWYRIEDVVAPHAWPPINIVQTALQKCGVTRDVTPQAMACLWEQARAFAQKINTDALDYAHVANRTEVTSADYKLAADMVNIDNNNNNSNNGSTVNTQLPRLHYLSNQLNKRPLPPIPANCYSGVVLPPAGTLLGRTYDLWTARKVQQKSQIPLPRPNRSNSNNNSNNGSNKPSYGATRGRPIPIQLASNKST